MEKENSTGKDLYPLIYKMYPGQDKINEFDCDVAWPVEQFDTMIQAIGWRRIKDFSYYGFEKEEVAQLHVAIEGYREASKINCMSCSSWTNAYEGEPILEYDFKNGNKVGPLCEKCFIAFDETHKESLNEKES